MSNYLQVISSAEKASTLEAFFRKNCAKEDLVIIALSLGKKLFFIAKKTQHNLVQTKDIFKGYKIDHKRKVIYFENLSNIGNNEKLEGCYFSSRQIKDKIQIQNDLFSQLSLFFFNEPDVIAFSDSLFVLSELRKFLKLPCTLRIESLIGRSFLGAITEQALNFKTPLKEITLAPMSFSLSVDVSGFRPKLICEKKSLSKIFQTHWWTSYYKTLAEAARNTSSLIETLCSLKSTSSLLSLSGGEDSRVLLAGALTKKENFNNLHVTSSERQEHDFEIAKQLSTAFSFPLNERICFNCRPVDPLSLWALSNCGHYDSFHTTNHILEDTVFQIGGHGGEIYKGMYSWRPLSQIAKIHLANPCPITRERGEIFLEESKKGLIAIGVDPEDPWGSEWHYLAYRNAIHGGRITTSSMLGFRPLMLKTLVGICRSRSNINPFPSPSKNSYSIISDLLVSLNTELALLPFENKAKNYDPVLVQRQLKRMKKVPSSNAYRVEGSYSKISSGPPSFFLNLARKKAFLGEVNKENLSPLLEKAREKIPAPEMKYFSHLFKEIEEDSNFKGRAKKAASKILSFLLTS